MSWCEYFFTYLPQDISWGPLPVSWPGEVRGLCSPRGRKESDTTEGLSLCCVLVAPQSLWVPCPAAEVLELLLQKCPQGGSTSCPNLALGATRALEKLGFLIYKLVCHVPEKAWGLCLCTFTPLPFIPGWIWTPIKSLSWVGCHPWKWKWSHSVESDSLRPHGLYVAHEAPLSMGFSRQEYWSRLPFPSPGDLPNSGTEPVILRGVLSKEAGVGIRITWRPAGFSKLLQPRGYTLLRAWVSSSRAHLGMETVLPAEGTW